jgi:hypothetical protein
MKKMIGASLFLSGLSMLACASGVPPVDDGGIAGIWTGDSICTVHPSPCNDEKVIYHVSKPDTKGDLTIQADKVVNGKPEDMGPIDCNFDAKASKVTCSMKNSLWEFDVKGDQMTGTLKLANGTLYRRISVKKQPEQ